MKEGLGILKVFHLAITMFWGFVFGEIFHSLIKVNLFLLMRTSHGIVQIHPYLIFLQNDFLLVHCKDDISLIFSLDGEFISKYLIKSTVPTLHLK